ncbi:MAG: hypothetical protein EOO47_05015 [Flavobacterium sp.]|nr:MAG: hypothetical protein EOO47_05015 [Flavobacterium sp.]
MILIDRSTQIQTIILTLTENSDGSFGNYVLNLTADGNRGVFTFILPPNTSAFTERFDLFSIETSVFNDLADGLYNYSISLNNVVVETGKAMVKSPEQPSEAVLQPNSSTNKILIYGE